MHRLLAALVPALLLGGCAFTNLEHRLSGLVGKDVDAAVAQLGAPNAERRLGDVRELEWNTFTNRATVVGNRGANGLPLSPSPYASAAPLSPGALLSTRSPVDSPSSWISTRPQYCKVIVQVDSKDVIRQTRYDGNFDGCYAYGQLLGKKA